MFTGQLDSFFLDLSVYFVCSFFPLFGYDSFIKSEAFKAKTLRICDVPPRSKDRG